MAEETSMPKGYLQVPDWFSFENQGGGVAVADLSGTGRQDLVVFMVDNAAGQNRGLFRVGRDLDPTGNPAGGWTAWSTCPTGSRGTTRARAWPSRTSTGTAARTWSSS